MPRVGSTDIKMHPYPNHKLLKVEVYMGPIVREANSSVRGKELETQLAMHKNSAKKSWQHL
jgi:hypothetical protein